MCWYEPKPTSAPDIRHAEEGFDSEVNHGLNDSEEGSVLPYQSR